MNTSTTAAAGGYSVFNAMVDIIAAPGRALDEVRQHPRWLWWPLLTLLVVTILAFVYYQNWVDFEWLVDEAVRGAIAQGTPADQAEAIRGFMSPTMQLWMTVIGVVVVTFVIYALLAGYFHLVNKSIGDPALGYGQWFSFVSWTSFVGVFGAVVMFVVMFMADSNQLAQHDLSPLSLNGLVLHQVPGDAWFNLGNSISLLNVWMLALATIGFSRWTGKSIGTSAVVACAPWVLLFGIWAALIAF